MKYRNRVMVALFCLVLVMLSGCHLKETVTESGNISQKNDGVMPEQVLQIGDSFDYTPFKATGHLSCKVTNVRVVTEAAECPPKEFFSEDMIWAMVDGESIEYEYEEWFTEGGAFDHGGRLLLADLTVTNVDAHMRLDNGTFYETGDFLDPYLFYGYYVVTLADLTRIEASGDGSHQNYTNHSTDYYSYMGQFFTEDNPDSIGYEPYAIRIAPGETVKYTVGFLLDTDEEGNPKDLSKQWLCVGAYADVKEGIFIDTALEGDGK